MGSKSKSSTSNTQHTTNVQDIDTTTIGLEDVETGIVGNSGDVQITQISTDQGAVDASLDFGREVADSSLDFAGEFGSDALKRAFDFGSEALGTVDSGLHAALDFGDNTVERGFDFGSEAIGAITKAQESARISSEKSVSALTGALNTVGSLSRSDTSASLTKIIPWIAGAIAASFLGYAFIRRAA